MNTLEAPNQLRPETQGLSWSSQLALTILAVDEIRPIPADVELMRLIDTGEITYEQAIQTIVDRAYQYANPSL
jgi:hypothetical protein